MRTHPSARVWFSLLIGGAFWDSVSVEGFRKEIFWRWLRGATFPPPVQFFLCLPLQRAAICIPLVSRKPKKQTQPMTEANLNNRNKHTTRVGKKKTKKLSYKLIHVISGRYSLKPSRAPLTISLHTQNGSFEYCIQSRSKQHTVYYNEKENTELCRLMALKCRQTKHYILRVQHSIRLILQTNNQAAQDCSGRRAQWKWKKTIFLLCGAWDDVTFLKEQTLK